MCQHVCVCMLVYKYIVQSVCNVLALCCTCTPISVHITVIGLCFGGICLHTCIMPMHSTMFECAVFCMVSMIVCVLGLGVRFVRDRV